MPKVPFKPSCLATSVRSTLVGSGAAVAMGFAGATSADQVDELRNQVEILMQKIEQLEQQQQEMQDGQDELEDQVEKSAITSDIPGTFKIPGTETSVSVSGYVKLDAFIDSDQDVGDSFIFSSIVPDDVEQGDTHTRFHARQSRFRIRSNTDLGNDSAIKTHIEGDFFGTGGNQSFSNSTSFRLRHAYASYDLAGGAQFLAGQTWSNFMENDFVAYPSTVDFFGPVGKNFVRAPQVRWTWPSGFAISLENPETDGTGAGGRLRESTGGQGTDELPDLTAAWRGGPGGGGGVYELGAVIRDLGASGTTEAGVPIDDGRETGWGIMLAGGWQAGKVYISGSLTGGDGIGRYIINGFANDIFVNDDGSVETVESAAANVNFNIAWSDTAQSNLAFGHFENDEPARSNGIDTLDSIHLNYLWNPWPAVTFGVEWIHGEIENADGSDGDNDRLHFMAQRSF